MSEKGYTQTIPTADFIETPNVVLEQPTGDVHVESWDRPEIEVSIDDEGIFEIEQSGSQVIIKNRPGKFKLVDFLEEAGAELSDLGVDLSKVTARVERGLERNIQRRMQRDGPQLQLQSRPQQLEGWPRLPHHGPPQLRPLPSHQHRRYDHYRR